jgi:hypothetical protein
MDSSSYVAFLVIGTVLVLIDGQIIYRNGRRFLQQATPNAPAESLTKLVSVLFHLGTLGVLALISAIDIGDYDLQGIMVRLGIILIVLGIAHWIAVSALGRIRDREEYEEYTSAERDARRKANEAALRAQGTYVPEPTESPAYNGESATAVVNPRQQQYPPR